MYQGDEAGILVEFLMARLRVNTGGWPVKSMPMAPDATFPCYGFNFTPGGPVEKEQGGDVLYSTFTVNVFAVGGENVDDLEPLRPMAKEAAAALRADSSQLGTRFGTGLILSCIVGTPVSFSDRDEKGVLRWYHGHQWVVKVQPDVAAN